MTVQSLVYAAMAMDSTMCKLKNGTYPEGMLETTHWLQHDAMPHLHSAAKVYDIAQGGSEWLYNVCENYGENIAYQLAETGDLPSCSALRTLARVAVMSGEPV
jgi:hypothetical protein